MKTRQCYCGRPIDPNKRKVVNLHLSNGTCDVYGCPASSGELQNGWIYDMPPPAVARHGDSSSRSHHKAHRGTTSAARYFFDSLAKSSINGLSNVISTKSVVGKLIWLCVFVGCVVGFSYQASHFIGLYRNQPSVVQIEVENDGEVEFPAVTVCNKNRFRRNAVCEYFPDRCKTGYLSEYEINDILYNLLLNKSEFIKRDLGHNETMFIRCEFIGHPSAEGDACLKIWEYFYDPDYGNCFTFTSKNEDNLALQARKVDFWQEENDLTVIMDVEPEEFMEMRRSPGLIVVVHDEKTLPDIHTEGIHIGAGYSYTLTVAKSTVFLLPPPYKTNCTNYNDLPWQKLYHRRLTSRVCTVGCSQHFQFQKCKVVTKNLSLFYTHLPYTKEDLTNESLKCAIKEEERTKDYCRSICGLPCRDTVYTASASASVLTGKELDDDVVEHQQHFNMSFYQNTIHLRIFYSTLEHKIFRHIPKYDTMELFSFLGGYSGVWLGFSLLTVYELLEIIFCSVLFFIKNQITRRKHKKFIHSVVSSRKHAKTGVKSYKKKKFYG